MSEKGNKEFDLDMSNQSRDEFKSGFVSILGRPNVGKSTLMNALVGQKLSITSHKVQTTRHQITGILTANNYQIVFIDTPGLHQDYAGTFNKHLNKTAKSSLQEVDVVILVLDANHFSKQDKVLLEFLEKTNKPLILAVNKIDKISNEKLFLYVKENLDNKFEFKELLPISACKNKGLESLKTSLTKYLSHSDLLYDKDIITTKTNKFFIQEIVREKIVRNLNQELPYETSVILEKFESNNKKANILATIYVAKESQKAIVIGSGGSKIKVIGEQSRLSIKEFFDLESVYIRLYVKVLKNWSENSKVLADLGYDSSTNQ